MKNSALVRSSFLVITALLAAATLSAQDSSNEGRLRAANAQLLRLRGLLESAGNPADVRSQASEIIAQRQALLESLMEANPSVAAGLALPTDVLDDLAAAFPESAPGLEERGRWQGLLELFVEDGSNGSSAKERRRLHVGNDVYELFTADPRGIGTQCSETIAASGVRSNNKIVSETNTIVYSSTNPCSTTGAQKIAVILVNFPSTALPAGITPDYMNGVFLGNAYTTKTASPDRNVSDFWYQNSDGKTFVPPTGVGALTVVGPITLAQDYAYCTYNSTTGSYSDNSGAVRAAAYAAADPYLNYNDFARVVVVVPHNSTCNGIAGVGTIGCWSSESPGDGATNFSWTWWRADQISTRVNGVELATHEMGHNLGLGHSGSRYHAGVPVGPIGVAGTRTEYGDTFETMGSWNLGFYNSSHALNQLGWLSSSNVQTVTSNGTFTLQGYDGRPNGLKSIKVQRGTGNTTSWFYISFLPATNPVTNGIYVSSLGSQIHTGAIIHYQDVNTPGGKTDLLDFTPATGNNFSDPALASGQTWVDPNSDVVLSVGSIVNSGADLNVTVTYNAPPCSAAVPTVTISPLTNNSVQAGSPYNFTVTVKNNDSISCSSRTFNLTSTLPSDLGWGSSFSPVSLTIGPGASANATLTKTPPVTAVGTYSVNATASSGADTDTTDTNASLTVTVPVPAAPTGLTGSAQYSGSGKNKVFKQVNLAWTDNSFNEDFFDLERCKVSGKGGSTTCTVDKTVSVAANTKTYADLAPIATGTYKYRVRARSTTAGTSAWTSQVQVQIQ